MHMYMDLFPYDHRGLPFRVVRLAANQIANACKAFRPVS